MKILLDGLEVVHGANIECEYKPYEPSMSIKLIFHRPLCLLIDILRHENTYDIRNIFKNKPVVTQPLLQWQIAYLKRIGHVNMFTSADLFISVEAQQFKAGYLAAKEEQK